MSRPIGIMAAIPEELGALLPLFKLTQRTQIQHLAFLQGTLNNQDVVIVEVGIGKVNAAMTATLLIREFGCSAIIFCGVAGGLDDQLAVGDIVIANKLICYDYGLLTDGKIKPYQPGIPPLPHMSQTYGYLLQPELEEKLRLTLSGISLPTHVTFGTILTGDVFLNCAATRETLHRELGGQAVEMEGAAVAQVAEAFRIPLVVIRALSDLAGDESHTDFNEFARSAADNAAAIVSRIVPLLAS